MADPFDLPSIRQQLAEPIKTLARIADFLLNACRPAPALPFPDRHVTLVCISDSHTGIPARPLPRGDILIHAGDLTNRGTPAELQAQIDWLDAQPHGIKVAIAGNHDTYCDPRSRGTLPTAADRVPDAVNWKSVRYLQDEAITVTIPVADARPGRRAGQREITLYGSPHIPACGGPEFAFQYPRPEGRGFWAGAVPARTDVLVTHTPPRFHLDLAGGGALGDAGLLREVRRVRPRIHVFGHVHAGKSDVLNRMRGGREVVRWDGGAEEWFERVMERTNAVRGVAKVLDVESWRCLAFLIYTGIRGVVKEWLWGARSPSTWMVNASLTYRNTGRLLNDPQVIYM